MASDDNVTLAQLTEAANIAINPSVTQEERNKAYRVSLVRIDVRPIGLGLSSYRYRPRVIRKLKSSTLPSAHSV